MEINMNFCEYKEMTQCDMIDMLERARYCVMTYDGGGYPYVGVHGCRYDGDGFVLDDCGDCGRRNLDNTCVTMWFHSDDDYSMNCVTVNGRIRVRRPECRCGGNGRYGNDRVRISVEPTSISGRIYSSDNNNNNPCGRCGYRS